MTVYTYDNAKIDVFTTFNGGDITVGSSENIDYGDINQHVEPERDGDWFFVNDHGLITATADVVPFGPINVVDGRDALGRSRSQWIPENANTVLFDVNDSALESAVTPWVGTGTIHEIGSGLERIVIPDLGAAGAVIFIPSGTAEESISRGNYDGTGAIAKSGLSVTDLDQVYPYNGSGTLTLSGTTTTPYDEAYLPVIKNAFRAKGGDTRLFDVEKVIYNYARSESDVFEKEDNGTITVREGASFDDLNVTFDETITDPLAKERSFSDEDQVEFVSYGSILDTPTSAEDRGVIEQKLQGGIFLDEYQSTFVGGRDAIVRGYAGAGTFKKEGTAAEESLFAYSGSGTGTFSGTNFFSQAPQSTIFGVGDTITASGSANESFVPAGIISTVLFDISGTGSDAAVSIPPTRKALIRPSGSVSDIKLVKQGDEQTVTLHVSGAATNIQVAKDYENTNLFDISGEMQQGIPVYTPSWISPLGDQKTEEVDWGLITATPTQSYEDWGVINTNDETIPKSAENWGFLLPNFNYAQIGGQHYPNREITFSLGETSFTKQTVGVTGTATFLLSEDLDVAAAIQYESSGITGIATYKAGINIFGANWFSQAPQHTVFGEEGQFSILGTGSESITPFIPEGSGSLFKFGGAVEASVKEYLVGSYQSLTGAANVNFAPHISSTLDVTLTTGREEGQTYARVIQHPEDEFGGTLFFSGKDIFEKNTDSYNQFSIFRGTENEDYGLISELDVAQGFGFNQQGAGMPSVESLDDGAITFDNENAGGLTYDEAVSGTGLVPSFDKTNQYNVNFSSNEIGEDYGIIGVSSGGGRPYTRTYPWDNGFTQQNVNRGFTDYGWVDETTPQEAIFPYGSVNFTGGITSGVPIFFPFYRGSGTITISGTGGEKVAVASSTTSLFDFVSGAKERYIAQTPEGTVLFETSGITTYSRTRDFVGSGTLPLTRGIGISTYARVIDHVSPVGIQTFRGSAVVKSSFDPPEGTYLHIYGGGYTDLKAAYAAQSEKAVLRLIGDLQHPDIDYTPHYGIERNIGIETGLTLKPGSSGGEYGDPGIVTTRFIPKYPSVGPVLKLDGRSISRTNAPISTHGVIYILGIGTAGNGVGGPDEEGDLEGVEFGAKERFVPATEFGAGSLLFDFQTTGAEARPVQVFGYYGDDNDPGTSGGFTVRQEGGILTIEKFVVPEVGSGTFTYSGAGQDEKTTFSEVGGGSLFAIGGISETKTSAELVAGTSIFNGTAEESFIAQTPENTATLTLSGESVAFRLREFDGSGTITLRRDNVVLSGVRLSATGSGSLFALGSAAEATVEPSAASAILTRISGDADTRTLAVFQDFVPSGTFTISGELTHPDIDYTPAYTGIGNVTISGTADEKGFFREIGVGIATFSGASVVRFTADSVEGTVLFDTKGASALTALNQVYGYYGDDRDPGTSGITTIFGDAATRYFQVFQDFVPSGTFTISNTSLVHPFVDYTPSIGIGVAVLYKTSGSALESVTKGNYTTQGFFKGLAGAKESQARATYVGIGQVNSFGIAQTEYAVIEEGRTYVVII